MVSPAKSPFLIICAWCGRQENPSAQVAEPVRVWQPTTAVSHTICERCFVSVRADIERQVRLSRKRSSA